MVEPCLIIFIDGFAFDYLEHAPYLRAMAGAARMIPGMGYSVNQKAMQLGPYSPDEAGYFCQWTYDPHSPLRKLGPFFGLLRILDVDPRFSALSHRALSKLTGIDLFRIPFKYLKYYSSNRGIEAYTDAFPLPTVLSRRKTEVRRLLYSQFPYGPQRDTQLFEQAGNLFSAGPQRQFFVASADLDSVGHRHGPRGISTVAKVKELDALLARVIERFEAAYPGGSVCVFSDHGMAQVTREAPLQFEKALGPAGEQTYLYFLDSTLVRVWSFNDNVHEEAGQYLDSLAWGKRLSDKERQRFGVSSPQFGDIIYLLREGITPARGFAGGLRARALHGYDPLLSSQHGVFLTNRIELLAGQSNGDLRVGAAEVPVILNAALGNFSQQVDKSSGVADTTY